MARYSASWSSITHGTGVADGSSLVSNTYPLEIVGGSATQRVNINEVFIGGEAASTSAPTVMRLGRDSTIAVTATSAGNALLQLMDASATAPTSVPSLVQSATTNPTRSTTLGRLLALSFNAYGGIARWQARYGEEISLVGNTASLGAMSLSAFTGSTTAATSGHIILEVA
jgi:hypothetical protein